MVWSTAGMWANQRFTRKRPRCCLRRMPGWAEAPTTAQLEAVTQAAIARLAAAGEDVGLTNVTLRISDLNSRGALGLAGAGVIVIDDDGLGHGWFIDPTSPTDEEFTAVSATELAAASSEALNRVDLLTVVMHELGHILGQGHVDAEDQLMSTNLGLGVRRLPADDHHHHEEDHHEAAVETLGNASSGHARRERFGLSFEASPNQRQGNRPRPMCGVRSPISRSTQPNSTPSNKLVWKAWCWRIKPLACWLRVRKPKPTNRLPRNWPRRLGPSARNRGLGCPVCRTFRTATRSEKPSGSNRRAIRVSETIDGKPNLRGTPNPNRPAAVFSWVIFPRDYLTRE